MAINISQSTAHVLNSYDPFRDGNHCSATPTDPYKAAASLPRHSEHEFANAEVVNHLSDAEQRRHDQHATESALEQCTPAFRSECTTKHTHTHTRFL